jgi:2-oxoglutarate dehydrogenase E1 component
MGFENHEFEAERGPSWQRPNWRFIGETDDLTASLDPTQMAVEDQGCGEGGGQADGGGRRGCAAGGMIPSAP